MGRTYAEVISRYLPGAELGGVAGGSRAADLSRDYGVKRWERWEDLCRDPSIDAVVIATPHEWHARQAILAIKAGKHVMIEKPMAASVQECLEIIETAMERGVRTSVAFTQRKRLCNKLAKEILQSGTLGPLQHIQGWHVVPAGTSSLPAWQNKSGNIGVLLGHGIHLIDAVRWFSGQEIDQIAALCGNYSAGYEVEASSDVLLHLSGGCRANLVCSFEPPRPGFSGTQFGFRIVCANGLIDLDAYGSLKVSEAGKPFQEVARQSPIDWQSKGFLDPVRLESYTEHLEEFCSSIHEGTDLGADGIDGFKAVAAVFAAYESSTKCTFVRPAALIDDVESDSTPRQGRKSVK
jgi:predicted dehydrogenase